MLSYFPTPYPDEIFYSLIARYFLHLGFGMPSRKLLSILFGKEVCKPIIDFPGNLSHFQQQVGDNLKCSLDELINRFTLLPLYSPSITASRKQLIFDSMTNPKVNYYFPAKNISSLIFPSLRCPRYCPYCFEEDLINFGESYWHRSHQIPSLPFCTIHSCYLRSVPVNPVTISSCFFIPPVKTYCPEVASQNLDNNEALEIGKRLLLLFQEGHKHEFNINLHRRVLLTSNFKKGKCTVDLPAFYNAFSAFYSLDTLQLFHSMVNISSGYCWLKSSIRNNKGAMDPIRYILLHGFLSSIRKPEAFKTETSNASNKYPCRNLICQNYNKLILNCMKERYSSKTKGIIKTICCSACGYTYTRSNKMQPGNYKFKVKDYGLLWKDRLHNLYQEGLSARKISEIMGCSPAVVRYQYAILCSHGPSYSESKKNNKLQEKQSQWIALIRENPQLSKTQLRHLQGGLYDWLYLNSNPWLDALNYPKPKIKNRSKIIDWKKREQEYLKAVKKVYQNLVLNKEERRISKSLLIRLISNGSKIHKSINKMPKLKEYLDSVSETAEKYMLRRLILAYEEMLQQEIAITRMHLLKKAKISKKFRSTTIEEEVQRLMLVHLTHQTNERRKLAS